MNQCHLSHLDGSKQKPPPLEKVAQLDGVTAPDGFHSVPPKYPTATTSLVEEPAWLGDLTSDSPLYMCFTKVN